MTINEVEHAIRSLIVSQPMITASPIGGTITSYLSIIDSFKNFKLSVLSEFCCILKKTFSIYI